MKMGGQTTPAIASKPKIQTPQAPTNAQVTSHTVSPDGTVKQTYATPATSKNSGVMSPSTPSSQQNANAGSIPSSMQYNADTNYSGTIKPKTEPNNAIYTGLIGNLTKAAQDTTAIDQANNELEQLRKSYANAVANEETRPIPLEFQQGRTQVIGRQFASQESAAEQKLANALTARGQTITGLGTAAGIVQPVQVPYNNQYIDPTTGLPVNPQANQSMQDAVALQAQKLRAGTTSPQDAANALSAYGQAGTNMLQQMLGTSFNIPQATGLAQASQSNAQISGTSFINAANTGYQGAVQDYANMNATNNAADAQIGQVQSVLQSTGLNQNIPDANKAINTLQTKLGDAAYTQLVAAMTELQNIYSQLLTAGGTTPTGSETQAILLLNPNSSASQIQASIGQLQTAAYNRIKAQYDKMQTFQGNLQGGSPQGGGNGGNSVSAGGYNFVKDASGNWVPA